jgi:hypothetical protein
LTFPVVTFSKKYVITVNFIMKKTSEVENLAMLSLSSPTCHFKSLLLKGEELTGSYLKATTCGLLRRPQLTQGW